MGASAELTPGLAGWTCGVCGAWVANGTTHTCLRWHNPSAFPSPARLSDEEVERIAQRIAEILREG